MCGGRVKEAESEISRESESLKGNHFQIEKNAKIHENKRFNRKKTPLKYTKFTLIRWN